MIRWHHMDMKERMYCLIEDGKKIAMPRYYKLKIYDDAQRLEAAHHQLQKMLERKMEADKNMTETDYHNQKEAVKAAIRKFNIDIKKRQKL